MHFIESMKHVVKPFGFVTYLTLKDNNIDGFA